MNVIYMNCFICGQKIDASTLTPHLKTCKEIWDAKCRYEEGYGEGGIMEKFDQYKEDKKKYKEYCETLKQSKIPSKIRRSPGQRPRTVKCPLCDTEFSVGAWKIHIKRCKEKEIEYQKYFSDEHKRDINKIVNDFMKAIDEGVNKTKIKTKGKYDVDNLGDEAYQNNNLVKCSSCGRSFAPERLANHQKICFKHPELFKKK